jgi:hypothetical protein
MTIRRIFHLLVAPLCSLLCVVSIVSAGRPKNETCAGCVFDKASPSVHLPGGPPDYVDTELRRTSPDGEYVAQLICGGGEVGYLAVYRRGTGGWRMLRRGRVSRIFEDARGCAWVPRHGHWLLVSAGGADYGPGLLARWTGQRYTRILRRAASPVGEGFNVRSVSRDGRLVIYEHFGDNSPDTEDKRNTRLCLLLPQS